MVGLGKPRTSFAAVGVIGTPTRASSSSSNSNRKFVGIVLSVRAGIVMHGSGYSLSVRQ